MKPAHTRLDATAVTLMLVLCSLWGLNQVAIKVANAGISPVLQAGLRSAGAAVLVWAWSAWGGVRLFDRDGPHGLGVIVGLLFAIEFLLIYWGLAFTTASRSVVLLYTSPFVVALGAHLFVPGERLRMAQVIGLIAAFVGVLLVFGDALRLPTSRELIGDAMIFVAAGFWGATTVVIKATRLAAIHPNKTLFYQLAISALLLPPVSLLMGEPGFTSPGVLALGSLAFQIAIISFASYLAWFWLITQYPASRLAAFTFLTPVIGVPAGALLLNEPISPALAGALALVALGIYLVNRAPAKRDAAD